MEYYSAIKGTKFFIYNKKDKPRGPCIKENMLDTKYIHVLRHLWNLKFNLTEIERTVNTEIKG
jgi:hypothetical protein